MVREPEAEEKAPIREESGSGHSQCPQKAKGSRWKPSSDTPGKATKKCTLWWHQGSVRGEARLPVVQQGKLATKMPHSPVLLDQGRGGMFHDLENSRLESID